MDLQVFTDRVCLKKSGCENVVICLPIHLCVLMRYYVVLAEKFKLRIYIFTTFSDGSTQMKIRSQ